MEILTTATAGSLESNDVLVKVSPNPEPGIKIELTSIVYNQFKKQILAAVQQVLDQFGVSRGVIEVKDQGALDYAIKARVESALCRSKGE